MRSEGFLQPAHRVDHGILDGRPFGLVTLVAAGRDDGSNPTSPLVVEPLPGQLAAEIPLDLFPPAVQPVENALVRLTLIRPTVDVQLGLALVLADGVDEG